MKYNLKTLLDMGKLCKSLCGLCEYCWVDEAKGFEKELRELLNRRKYKEKGYCPVWDNAFDYCIKEILGE